MLACDGPQNSAQNPLNADDGKSLFGVNHRKLLLFEIKSRLPPSCGIQKECRTSNVLSSKLTVRPFGRYSSFAVVMPYWGYLNSHHHW